MDHTFFPTKFIHSLDQTKLEVAQGIKTANHASRMKFFKLVLFNLHVESSDVLKVSGIDIQCTLKQMKPVDIVGPFV